MLYQLQVKNQLKKQISSNNYIELGKIYNFKEMKRWINIFNITPISIERIDFSKRKGVSCLLVNTNRGNEILEKYGEFINKVPVDIEKVKIINTQLKHPTQHTNLRIKIFQTYKKIGYSGVDKIYRKQLYLKKGKNGLKKVLKFIGLH